MAAALLLAAVHLGASPGQEEGGGTAAGGEAMPELDLPDTLPLIPVRPDPSAWDYDDMSKSYDFEILSSGYWFTPVPDDPINEYLNEQLNANIEINFLPGDDLVNQLTTRFIAGDPPAITTLSFGQKNVAKKLHEDGLLLNVEPYLQYLPTWQQFLTKDYKAWATSSDDGVMYGLPRYPVFADNWGLQIRKDWLEQFGMDAPSTESELFEFAQRVVRDDPNGTGSADTWFMGGAGDGNGFTMLEPFRTMYGHPGWNVKDGVINHPNLDGTSRSFVLWLKRLRDAGVLHPDWFTISWENFTAYSMNDQIAMVYYPGWNLIFENTTAHDGNLAVSDVWQPIDPPMSDDGRGGAYGPGGRPGRLLISPKSLEKDEGLVKRIMHFHDFITYPNQGNIEVIEGGGEAIFPGSGERHFYPETGLHSLAFADDHPGIHDPEYLPLGNWNVLSISLRWKTYEAPPYADDDPLRDTKARDWAGGLLDQMVIPMPRVRDFELLIDLDASTATRIKDLQLQRELEFILGERDISEWDAYIEEWKQAGGEELMKVAAEQLGASMP
jgi:ABC-type glycerol-3-phosphate transport system substrate-binding protein